MIELKKFPNYKAYLVYIHDDYMSDPIINYTLNDIPTETIITKNFFYLPLHLHDVNKISLALRFKQLDNNFIAYPMGIIKMYPHAQEKHFLTNLRWPDWLELIGAKRISGIENHNIYIDISSQGTKLAATNLYKCKGKDGETDLDQYNLGTPSFAYIKDSWMVGYYCKKQNNSGHIPYHMKFRISKSIHVNCSSVVNTNNKYNYLMIGQKTIKMANVQIIKKIHNPIDWLNSFYQMLALSHATTITK